MCIEYLKEHIKTAFYKMAFSITSQCNTFVTLPDSGKSKHWSFPEVPLLFPGNNELANWVFPYLLLNRILSSSYGTFSPNPSTSFNIREKTQVFGFLSPLFKKKKVKSPAQLLNIMTHEFQLSSKYFYCNLLEETQTPTSRVILFY